MMEAPQQPDFWLRKKIDILERIAANTETHSYFISKRKMASLRRVLQVREELLAELAAANGELAADQRWKTMATLAPLRAALKTKKQEVLSRSGEIVQQAIAERARIADELKGGKAKRQLQNQYVNNWRPLAPGVHFNAKI